MLRNFEQQLPPTFQLSKTQNLSLSFYLKLKSLANYNITLKSYQNKISQLGWPQLMTLSTVTSRHVTSRHDIVDAHDAAFNVRHITSGPRTLRCIDVVDVVSDTSSLTLWTRPRVMSIFLRLRLGKYHMFIEFLISKLLSFLKLIISNLHSNCC